MSGQTEHEVPDQKKTWIYWTAIGLLVVAVVIGLFTFSSARSTAQAQDKADQFSAALEDAGLTAPSQDQIVRVLGDDGGALCEDPGSALRKAILFGQLVNGAAGPGQRPVVADNRVVQGQLIAIQVYCPDELADFKESIQDLDFGDVIKQ
jgi:Tfp pilus assembly protein FimT